MLRVLCLLVCLVPATALAAPWRLDPSTRISVEVTWQGRSVEVRFPEFSGRIEFDAERPATAEATIVVSARAAETGLAPVNALVRSRDYLAADTYPSITFHLTRLAQTSKSTAEVQGEITLRGTTRPIRFHAEVFRYGPSGDDPGRFEAGFHLAGQVDRTAFGSTGGLPEVAAVVPIRIRLLMTSR
jgi:polyisoprenoid-binding protein YceI